MKKCGKCGEVKSAEAFSKMAASKDGLQVHCKACNAAYYAANREKHNEFMKSYRAENREKISKQRKVCFAAYYADNREKIIAQKKQVSKTSTPSKAIQDSSLVITPALPD